MSLNFVRQLTLIYHQDSNVIDKPSQIYLSSTDDGMLFGHEKLCSKESKPYKNLFLSTFILSIVFHFKPLKFKDSIRLKSLKNR